MDSWYEVTRKDWVIADLFEEVWNVCGGPVEAALYCRVNPRERSKTFYFNPGAARLTPDPLQFFHAVKCPPPEPSIQEGPIPRFGLLVGDQNTGKNG